MKLHFNIFLVFLLCFIFAQFVTAQNPGDLKWKYDAGEFNGIRSTPAIADDGTIYFGTTEAEFHAVYPDGVKKWSLSLGKEIADVINDPPAIGADGTIYFSCTTNKLYAVNPTGEIKWTFDASDDLTAPAIDADGTIYAGSDNNDVYAINPDGSLKWSFTAGDYISIPPVIGADGTIYIACHNRKLYAINKDGTLKWVFDTAHYIGNTPAIDDDGTIYFHCYRIFYALNPDGTQKWAYTSILDDVYSSPAIGTDGTIYFGTDDEKNVYAFNRDGTVKWTFRIGESANSSPAIDSDGTIYIGAENKKFYAINPDGTLKWSYTTDGNVYASPTIDKNGIVYIGSSTYLYALQTNSKGLASSPWPKNRQNLKNTGYSPSVTISEQVNFAFFNPNESVQKSFEIVNPTSSDITLTEWQFNNRAFSKKTKLPLTISACNKATLLADIQPENTQLYHTECTITYHSNNRSKDISTTLSSGLFRNDLSENAYIARYALEGYNLCKTKAPSSSATTNNLGILYRLLNEHETAEKLLSNALAASINNKWGYTGIKLNMGVIKSDQRLSSEALEFYSTVYNDIASNIDASVFAPKMYYNSAWENYKRDYLAEALTDVNSVLSHSTTNAYLKAKAHVLRGAIYLKQGNSSTAKDEFNTAISMDQNGPVGQLANEHLNSFNLFDLTISVLDNPALSQFLDIYVISKYGLASLSGSVSIDNDSKQTIEFEETSPLTFKADYIIEKSGNVTIEVKAVNLGNDEKVFKKSFNAQLLKPTEGGTITFEAVKLDVPAHALNSNTFFTISAGQNKDDQSIEDYYEMIGDKYYKIGPNQFKLLKTSTLSFQYVPDENVPAHALKIFTKENNEWKIVSQKINETDHTISAQINELGAYALFVDKSLINAPEKFKLYSNYPNPFNSETMIRYDVPDESNIKIDIYNIQGQFVKQLINQKQKAGNYQLKWDGTDFTRTDVSSGVYFCTMECAHFNQTIKLTVLR